MHDESTPERWRVVAGFPRYEVSDGGAVRSCADSHGGGTAGRHTLHPDRGAYGHPRVTLFRDGGRFRRLVPRLVLEAFVGPCPAGLECCHNDGDATNNHLSNLRWDTRKANMEDRARHDRNQHGTRNVNAKLTANAVREIRRLHAERVPVRAIAERFGVDVSNVRYITNGVTWRHVV